MKMKMDGLLSLSRGHGSKIKFNNHLSAVETKKVGGKVLGKIQALKFINPKCKVHRCVLGVSSAGSCVLSTGID